MTTSIQKTIFKTAFLVAVAAIAVSAQAENTNNAITNNGLGSNAIFANAITANAIAPSAHSAPAGASAEPKTPVGRYTPSTSWQVEAIRPHRSTATDAR